MHTALATDIETEFRAETERLLVQRVQLSLWLTLTFTFLFGIADLRFESQQVVRLYLTKLIQLVNVGVGLLAVYRWPTGPCATWTGLVTFAFICLLSAAAGIIIDDTTMSPMLITFVAVLAAFILPWSPKLQTVAALIAGGSIAIEDAVVGGSVTALVGYPAVVVVSALLASVCVSTILRRQRHLLIARDVERRQAGRALQEEAHISSTLARVSRELIAALHTPVLIDRLCELTANAVDCDAAHTVLWQAERRVFATMGWYGFTAEQGETMRLIHGPRSVMPAFLMSMNVDDVYQIGFPPGGSRAPNELAAPQVPDALIRLAGTYGVTRSLYVPLVRGSEVIGFLIASYRGKMDAFTTEQIRIARGIGQLASLVIERVQLLEALEHANRLKSEFVATMSHELRSPLNAIMGYNDLLGEGMFGPLTDEQRETIGRIDRSAQELLELINATLDLSRLEGGRIPLHLRDVDIRALFAEIEAEAQHIDKSPRVQMHWRVPQELGNFRTDPAKLKAVLKNLVVNAAKFTEQGQIIIASERDTDAVEFRVTDTGIGIPSEALPIIFEPFRQVDASTTRRHRGVGLGLYIVRRLVDSMNGTVSVESTVGHGSTFRIRLPYRPDEGDDAQPPETVPAEGARDIARETVSGSRVA